MGAANEIPALLPQLRRFARALTGSQKSGDAYVRATLEAMAESDEFVPEGTDATIALFGAFCRLWQSIDVNHDPEPDKSVWQASADLRLAAMVPEERMVFLLRQLEGFDGEQTAAILGVDVPTVEKLMHKAEVGIAEQLASRVLIIEDEHLISLDLSRLVTSLGHAVSSVARTHDEALAALAKERPGLILADIQLADGSSGLDAVDDILKERSLPIVFITAHPDLLLTGERPEPTYLVSKPYDPETVKAIISQVLFFQANELQKDVA